MTITLNRNERGAIPESEVLRALNDLDRGKLDVSGAAMTGPLSLPGNAIGPLHAVPKQQLDALIVTASQTSLIYTTLAALNANLAPAYGQRAEVRSVTPVEIGVDRKSGAPGAGSWSKIAALDVVTLQASVAAGDNLRPTHAQVGGAVPLLAGTGTRAFSGFDGGTVLAQDASGGISAFFDEFGRFRSIPHAPQWENWADSTYAFAIVDEAGAIVLGLTHGGTLHGGATINTTFYAYTRPVGTGTDIYLTEGPFDSFTQPAPVRATFGGLYGDSNLEPQVLGGRLHWVRVPLNAAINPTPQFASLDPKMSFSSGVTKLWMIPQTGQSNSNGSGGTVNLTTAAVLAGRVGMFALGQRILASTQSSVSLNDDVQSDTLDEIVDGYEMSNTNDRETGLAQLGARLAGSASADVGVLTFTAGIDAQTILTIGKGTTPYANLLRCVERGAFNARRRGWSVVVPAVAWVGSESECNTDLAAATMATQIQTLRTDLQADIQAITGQVEPVKLLIEQANSWTFGGIRASSQTPQGLVDAARADAHVILIGPNYWRTYQDGVHYDSTSHRARGWLQGEVLKRVLVDAATWTPLHMSSASRTLSTIDVQFSGADGGLQSGAADVTDPGNLGFVVSRISDGVVQTISSASILNSTTVRLALAADPGSACNVKLALDGVSGNNAGPTTGPRTPLRAATSIGTDPWGIAARKWACAGLVRSWTPMDLGAKLLAWWSADRFDLLTFAGSNVSAWNDVVAGISLTQATSGARPVYSATAMNGDPGITFDGIDDFLEIATAPASFPLGAAPGEIWGCADQIFTPAAPNNNLRYIASYGGSNAARAILRGTPAGINRAFAVTGDGATNLTTFDSDGVFFGRNFVRAQFGATETSITFSGFTPSTASVVPATTNSRVRIGATTTAGTASGFWGGAIRDVIMTSPLTTAEATSLAAYLTAHAKV